MESIFSAPATLPLLQRSLKARVVVWGGGRLPENPSPGSWSMPRAMMTSIAVACARKASTDAWSAARMGFEVFTARVSAHLAGGASRVERSALGRRQPVYLQRDAVLKEPRLVLAGQEGEDVKVLLRFR
jgi:hypothetical protein